MAHAQHLVHSDTTFAEGLCTLHEIDSHWLCSLHLTNWHIDCFLFLLLVALHFLYIHFQFMTTLQLDVNWNSFVHHFSASVEDKDASEPSGHSYRTGRKHEGFAFATVSWLQSLQSVIQECRIYFRRSSSPFRSAKMRRTKLTFTLSSSGLPGREVCEEKAYEKRQQCHRRSDLRKGGLG